MSNDPPNDRDFCRELLPAVSRTFALSIQALPPSLNDAVRTAYLLCRVVDTVEDEPDLDTTVRHQLFDIFDRLVAGDAGDAERFEELSTESGLAEGSAEGRLCRRAGAVFRCFRALPEAQQIAIRGPVLTMSRGMREYTDRGDNGVLELSDLTDLERYCYFVAGTVGELLTALFEDEVRGLAAERRHAIGERSVSFGVGLQLVNIVKDVAADYERGVCFLPVELARREGLDLTRLLEPSQREAGLRVVGSLCERAREHLERAVEYTRLWPTPEGGEVRLFCVVPLVLAIATLVEVETGDDTLRAGRVPKIDRNEVGRVLAESHKAALSNGALESMVARYR